MNDKIKNINEKRKNSGNSVKDAVKRACQQIRNIQPADEEEPEGLASGDMKKYLEDPTATDEKEEDE